MCNINNKALRTRIDGLNFTLSKHYSELESIEREKRNHTIRQSVNDHVAIMSTVFDFKNKSIEIIKNKAVIDLNDNFGVYAEIYFRHNDLFIILQLKGSFFVKENAFDLCRPLVAELSKAFNGLFRLTRIDIAQDFLLSVEEVLPIPSNTSPNVRYCFKHNFRTNFTSVGSENIASGFEIFAGRYFLILYDKILENEKARNLEKKSYYDKIFKAYSGSPVTRVELRLRQEACKKFIMPFYNPQLTEQEFIQGCLSQFYKKKKLRIKPQVSVDNDCRRWNVHPNWKAIFNSRGDEKFKGITSPDYRYTTPKKDITKAIENLVDVIASNYTEISIEQLKDKISSMNFHDLLKRSKRKAILKNETDQKFHAFLRELSCHYSAPSEQSSHMIAEGNCGGNVIPPLERMQSKNQTLKGHIHV